MTRFAVLLAATLLVPLVGCGGKKVQIEDVVDADVAAVSAVAWFLNDQEITEDQLVAMFPWLDVLELGEEVRIVQFTIDATVYTLEARPVP